jgi:hypothetical protein
LPYRRKIKPGQRAGMFDAPVRHYPLPRPRKRRRLGWVAGELERRVSLYRIRSVSFAARKDVPASVVLLAIQQESRKPRFQFAVNAIHEVVEDDELGVHLGVRLERRIPVALGRLKLKKRTRRPRYHPVNPRDEFVCPRKPENFRMAGALEVQTHQTVLRAA